ncbi:MAG: hypothetical protein JXC85_05715 [Candidatus Aenigmarchaeota archaeon]|nr:hypothetical protein [Candidatus Aenigmarchaeota archaeon]
MVVRFFLDSNVIADYIIINLGINEEKQEILREDLKEIEKYLKQQWKDIKQHAIYSFLLLELLRRKKHFTHHKFFTSLLAVSEVASVIYEKYCIDQMYERRIPFKYWFKPDFEIKIPQKILERIRLSIIKFHMLYISRKIIQLAENIVIQEVTDIITNKKRDTHDAFLSAQAVFNGCDFFVTNDGRLIRKMKKYKNIEYIRPERAYRVLCK